MEELIKQIPIDKVVFEQDCLNNYSQLCLVKKQTGQDAFFEAKKILHTSIKSCWQISDKPIGEISQDATVYSVNCDKHLYAVKVIKIENKSSYELKRIANEINIQQELYTLSEFATTPIYQILLNTDYLIN